jgi:hypothetical protein
MSETVEDIPIQCSLIDMDIPFEVWTTVMKVQFLHMLLMYYDTSPARALRYLSIVKFDPYKLGEFKNWAMEGIETDDLGTPIPKSSNPVKFYPDV